MFSRPDGGNLFGYFCGPMEFSLVASLLLGSVPLIMRRASIMRTNADKKMYFDVNFKVVTYYDKLFHKRLNSF